jgi:uncharacterized protein YndB with AHSA1/START domain
MTTKSVQTAVKIQSTPEIVWDHLTQETLLVSWLGEEARVDLRSQGVFRLTAGTPLVSGPHKILELEPSRKLTLQWNHGNFSTLVRIGLKPAKGMTIISVVHAVEGNPPYEIDDSLGGEAGQLKEMWAYNLSLLKTRIELGEAQCRLDPNRAPQKAVVHTLKLVASPSEVFDALVNQEKIRGWNSYAPNARVEKRKGGRYSFGWESEEKKTDGPGEVVEYVDGRKITYTWHGNPSTLVSWQVEPLGDDPKFNTRLKLVHSGFIRDQNMLVDWNLGWAAFLAAFQMFVEKGQVADWLGVEFET